MTLPRAGVTHGPISTPSSSANGAPVSGMAGGTMALRLAATLAHGWRRIVGIALGTMLVSSVVVLAMPSTYVSGTVLVPFSGAGSRSSIALAGLPTGVAGLIGASSPAERVLGPVLASRALNDTIVRRAGRDPKEQQQVGLILRDGVRISRNPDGSMIVQVRAPTPELAARVANTYPVAINLILAQVSTDGALIKQAFLRRQIDTAETRLTNSEQRYIEFAQRRAAPAPEQQAQRTIDAAATLQQGIFEQEIVIGQLRRTATPDNPELRAAESQLVARRAQLQQLTSGAQARTSVFVPVERGAELRVASTRIERQYQQDQRVYASLTAALEDAQIDASNSLPVFSVLDSALVPGGPARDLPTTATLGLIGGLMLGVITVLLGNVFEHMRRDPANAEYLAAFGRNGARHDAAVTPSARP